METINIFILQKKKGRHKYLEVMGNWECIPCERSIKKVGVRKGTWIGPQTLIK